MTAEPIEPVAPIQDLRVARRCPECELKEDERDAAIYALDLMSAKLAAAESKLALATAQTAARTVTTQQFEDAVLEAGRTYGFCVERGRYFRRFEHTVHAVLEKLGIQVVSA